MGGQVRPGNDQVGDYALHRFRAEVCWSGVGADGGEFIAVFGDVFEGSEASHGESGDGASGLFREGAEGGVHPGDELLDLEGLPVAFPVSGGHRVAVPADARVGHDHDEITSLGHRPDVEFPVVLGVISPASVEQVEHGVPFSAAGVIGGKQDVGVGIAACWGQRRCDARERWAGEGVGFHATVGCVVGDLEACCVGGCDATPRGSGADDGSRGEPSGSLEDSATADGAIQGHDASYLIEISPQYMGVVRQKMPGWIGNGVIVLIR